MRPNARLLRVLVSDALNLAGLGGIRSVRRARHTVIAAHPQGLGSIAYITDTFPRVSLTFVELEIEKLRCLGGDIDIYALRRSATQVVSGKAESLSNEITYLWPPPIWQLFRAHRYYAWKVPKTYIQILKFCLAPHPYLRLRLRTFCNFLVAPYFATSLAKKNIRHIHSHFASGAATVSMMTSGLLEIGFSFTAHGSDILIEKVLLNEKLKRAKFAIAVSEYNR